VRGGGEQHRRRVAELDQHLDLRFVGPAGTDDGHPVQHLGAKDLAVLGAFGGHPAGVTGIPSRRRDCRAQVDHVHDAERRGVLGRLPERAKARTRSSCGQRSTPATTGPEPISVDMERDDYFGRRCGRSDGPDMALISPAWAGGPVSARRTLDAAITLTAVSRTAAVLVADPSGGPIAAAVVRAVRRRAGCPVLVVSGG
jgi:hypothetical protein